MKIFKAGGLRVRVNQTAWITSSEGKRNSVFWIADFFYPAFFEGLDRGYFDHFLKQGKKEKYSILWSLLRQFHIWFRNYSRKKLNDERGVFASVLNLFLWLFSSLLHQSIMYMTGTRIRYVIQLSIKYKAPNCYNSV